MTRRIRSRIIPVGCTAVLLLGACRAQECRGSGPSPSPSPSPSPTVSDSTYHCPAPLGRWAAIVLFEKQKGVCARIATPPRVYARRGDDVIWRVYNQCGKDQTIKIADFVLQKEDPGIKSPDDDVYEQETARKAPASPSDDPFDGTDRKLTIKAGKAADLRLKVKADARLGVYAYYTYLADKPDADQQIEIWP